mgnify:CR=1 FL=1
MKTNTDTPQLKMLFSIWTQIELMPNVVLSKGPFTCMTTMPNMASSLSASILEFLAVVISNPSGNKAIRAKT